MLAEGELTGHRHAIYERVTMFRDDALAREIPAGLYVGHVKVSAGPAVLLHQEHAPIACRKAPTGFAASASSSRRTRCLSLIEVARLSDAQKAALATYGERWAGLRAATSPPTAGGGSRRA